MPFKISNIVQIKYSIFKSVDFDKTKRTHAEWAETNNFTWYSEDTLPEEWKSGLQV